MNCYTYTPNGNVKDKLVNGSKALSYTYTASGKVAGIIDKSGKKTTYRYDKAGRVFSVSDNRQLVAEYGYYEDGTLRQVKFANGVETSYTYNADKNYQSITTKTAEGEILLDYSYAYDGNGNRTKKVGSDAVSKYAGNDSASGVTNYIYDGLQRLQEVSYPNGKVEQFQYDNAGNRALKKYGTAENFKTGNYLEERYQYDNRNRLLERKNSQNVTYYQYDKQGNTVSELTKRFLKPETVKTQNGSITTVSSSLEKTELEEYRTYEYNAFNQTSKVIVEDYHENSKETHVQENFYDAENLRYGIEADNVRTNFVTNGWSVCTELDAEWKPTKRLVRGYGIVASEEIETATTTDVGSGYSNGYHYYHQNEHGDIEYITGKDGKIENAYTYDVFGNITNSTELVKNRYTYNGEQYDKVTEQYYLRARYYNPLVGRFTQEDVYRGDGLNLYAYCGSNPVMYVDPSGYDSKCNKGENSDPPRTEAARREAQKVVDVGNAIKAFDTSSKYKTKNPVTSVFVHENGTVSVGISGAANGNSNSVSYAQKLQNALNESAGYEKYKVSAMTDTDLLKQIKEVETGNIPGVCAEPKAATAAHYNDSEIVGMDTRYYTTENVPHGYNDSNQMEACDTCKENMEVYINYANNK